MIKVTLYSVKDEKERLLFIEEQNFFPDGPRRLKMRTIFFVVLLLIAPLAQAEFRCSSEIVFAVAPLGGGAPAAEGGKAEGRKTYFSTIEAKGESEPAAKEALAKLVAPAQEKAMAQCRKSYENNAECLAVKYKSLESLLQSLDYKGRAELQKAITSDCAAQSGKCVEASAGETKCHEVVAAAAGSEEAKAEGGEAAKDAGKGAKEAKKEAPKKK